MSDYNSSLPVRTENNGDVVSRISDGTLTSQLLTVNADGSLNITDNSGSLTVDATNLDIRDLAFATDKVDVSGSSVTVSSTDLDIRDLVFATDKVDVGGSVVALDAPTLAALESITVQNGSGAAAVNIQDGGNSITVDASNLDIRDLVFATDKVDVSGSSVTVSATDLDIRNLSHTQDSIKIGDGTDFIAINADGSLNITDNGGSLTVDATDLDIRDLSAAQDSVKSQIADGSGTYYSASNPVPVSIVDTISGATEVLDFKQATAIAGAASDTHSYTVTAAKTLHLQKIIASASGKMKVDIKIAGVTKAILFNSTANPNIEYSFVSPQNLAAAVVVSVVLTNLDNQSQNLYSTIEGYEV